METLPAEHGKLNRQVAKDAEKTDEEFNRGDAKDAERNTKPCLTGGHEENRGGEAIRSLLRCLG